MTQPKAASSASQLHQLKSMTAVVADTGDIEAIREYEPQDATTNPSLILKAVQMAQYGHLLDRAIADNKGAALAKHELIGRIADELLVLFGREILDIIPGRVSTETDARLSFDTEGIVRKAQELIRAYEQRGIGRERVLIKIASTWEGIRAAEILEKEGVHCNLTLLFSLPQAAACAEARVKLISPFVGRIYDWYRKENNREYTAEEDPGVLSVREIFAYFKKYDYPTEVMGASFRNIGQVLALAGCDLLTISPDLLDQLRNRHEPVERKLSPNQAKECPIDRMELDERAFRYSLNEDAMATEKTAEGIRRFAADAITLEKMIAEKV